MVGVSGSVAASAIRSSSTAAFLGSWHTPTDVRVCTPAGPSTRHSRSDAPSATSLCCVKSALQCTYTVMRSTDCSRARLPSSRCSSASARKAQTCAARCASARLTSVPTQPVNATRSPMRGIWPLR